MTQARAGRAGTRRQDAPPSIRDVAAEAGVSYQTVSRVLNDSPRVSPTTRRHILEVIERLGYCPNRAARALGLGRANGVTVVTSDTTLYGYARIIRGIEEAARGDRRTTIFLDERHAAAEATDHLLGLGHRTVHHVAIPSEVGTSGREAGWRDALGRAGRSAPPVVPVGWDARSAYLAGRELVSDLEVTAVLCGNDEVALGVRRAVFEAGRDVPGEVSIVGFDDVPAAAYWTPALTTVRVDFVAMGRACLTSVAAEMGGLAPPPVTLAAPALVVRESTAPPPPR